MLLFFVLIVFIILLGFAMGDSDVAFTVRIFGALLFVSWLFIWLWKLAGLAV